MTYAVEKSAKPGAGGNARVWVRCSCGRRFTVRASKVLNRQPTQKHIWAALQEYESGKTTHHLGAIPRH